MIFKTVELDGKQVAYTDETVFLVELGRGRGAYRTRWSFVGNLHRAVAHYRALNIGCGFKKRLRAPSFNKPLLARSFS
jgi:hypothetical protein